MNVHVKTGDTVVILSGKDKGKKGKVLAVSPKEGKVIVEELLTRFWQTAQKLAFAKTTIVAKHSN